MLRPHLFLAALALGASALTPSQAATSLQLTVSEAGCTPASLTAPEGDVALALVNSLARPIQWQIMADGKPVLRRDHVKAGSTTALSPHLAPGSYELTCGSPRQAHAMLLVTAAAAAAAGDPITTAATTEAPAPATDPLAKAAEGYKAYLRAEAGQLEAFTRQLTDAIKLGKLDEAQKLYSATHVHYERIRAVAQHEAELDKALNSPASAFEGKADDPAFTGFHRIEKALFADKATAPLADMADKLLADVLALNKAFAELEVTPASLIASAQSQVELIKSTLAAGGSEAYAGTDLDDLQAQADGAASALVVLRPALGAAQAQALDEVDGLSLTLNQILRRNREAASGSRALASLSKEDSEGLTATAAKLAEAMGKLKAAMAP